MKITIKPGYIAFAGGVVSLLSFFLPWVRYSIDGNLSIMSAYDIATSLSGTSYWLIFFVMLILPFVTMYLSYTESRWVGLPAILHLIFGTMMILLITFLLPTFTHNEEDPMSLIPVVGYGAYVMYVGDIMSIYGFKKINAIYVEEKIHEALERSFIMAKFGMKFLGMTKKLHYQKGRAAIIAIIIAGMFFTLPSTHSYAVSVKDNIIDEYLSSKPYMEVPEKTTYTITRYINSTSTNGAVTVYVPPSTETLDGKPLQVVDDVHLDPQPDVIDLYPTEKWIWNFKGPRQIKIYYNVTIYTRVFDFKPEQADISENINDTFEYGGKLHYKEDYLGKEWYNSDYGLYTIDPQNPIIVELANNLTEGKPTVYMQVKAIYDFMIKTFDYKIGRGLPKPALRTLMDEEGDCDDQSSLMISLLRAKGIPAWLELGMLYIANESSWGGHAWTDVYIPTIDGMTDDYGNPLPDMIATIDVVNNIFLVHSALLFTDYIDDGNGNDLDDYYHPYSVNQVNDTYVTKNAINKGYVKIYISLEDVQKYIPAFEIIYMPAVFISSLLIVSWRRRKFERY